MSQPHHHREAKAIDLPGGRRLACTVPAEAMLLFDEIERRGAYRDALQRLESRELVLDVGANVGLASLHFLKLKPDLRIVAVEAAPDIYACLLDNMKRYAVGVKCVNVAVCDESNAMRSFTYYPNAPGNSSLLADPVRDTETTKIFLANQGIDAAYAEEMTADLHQPVTISVPTMTVSDLLRAAGGGRVGLLKIDVERAELLVLQGIDRQDWGLIKSIVLEVHVGDGRLDKIRTLLEGQAFHVSVHQDPSLEGTELVNVLASKA